MRATVLLQALLGGIVVAVVGGVAFYCACWLFLSLISIVLPLAGGPPKIVTEWRRRRKRV